MCQMLLLGWVRGGLRDPTEMRSHQWHWQEEKFQWSIENTENEERGSGDNSEFPAGRSHSSSLNSTLPITVPGILKDRRAPSNWTLSSSPYPHVWMILLSLLSQLPRHPCGSSSALLAPKAALKDYLGRLGSQAWHSWTIVSAAANDVWPLWNSNLGNSDTSNFPPQCFSRCNFPVSVCVPALVPGCLLTRENESSVSDAIPEGLIS